MPDITSLPAATTPLDGTEVLPIVQGGRAKKVLVSDATAALSTAAQNSADAAAASAILASASESAASTSATNASNSAAAAASSATQADSSATIAQVSLRLYDTVAAGEAAVTTAGNRYFVKSASTAFKGVYEMERTSTGSKFIGMRLYGADASLLTYKRALRGTIASNVSSALFDVWGSDAWEWDGRVVPNRATTVLPTLNGNMDPFDPLDENGITPTREPNTTATTDNTGAGTNYAEKLTSSAQAQELTVWRLSYGTIPTDTYRIRVDHKLIANTATWRVGQNSASGTAFTATGTWATAEKSLASFNGSSTDLGVSSQTGNADGVLAIQNLSFYDSYAGESTNLPTPAQELAAQKAGHMKRVGSFPGAFSLTSYGSVNIDGANGAHMITVDPAGVALTTGFTFGLWVNQTELSAATNAVFMGFDNHAALTNGASGSSHGQIGLTGSAGANTTGTVTRLGKLFCQPNSSSLSNTPTPLHYIPNQGLMHLAMTMKPNGDGTTATHTLWVNGVPQILTMVQPWTVASAPVFARMLIGAWNNTTERRKTANPAKGDGTGFYFFTRALSDTEMVQRDRYMIEQLRLDGGSPGLRKLCLIFEGDSLTAFSPSWAWHLSDRTDLSPRLHMYNVAVGGTGLGGAYYTNTGTGGAAVESDRFVQMKRRLSLASQTYQKVAVVARMGTNEYSGATDPPHPWGTDGSGYPAWRTDYLNYIAALKAQGSNIEFWHCTLPPVVNVGGTNMTTQVQVETARHVYNDDMRNNRATYGIDRILETGLGTERMTGIGVFTSETISGGRVMNNWRYCNGSMTTPQVGSGNRSPATSLTLSAASGSAITATAGLAGTFLYHDVGRKITAGALGYGIITAVDGTGTTATLDTRDLVPTAWSGEPALVTTRDTVTRGGGFDATSYISGAWSIKGNGERWNSSDGLHQTSYGGREECDFVASTIQAVQDTLNGIVE